MSDRVDARRMGSAVLRRWWLVLALMAVGAVFGSLTSLVLPRTSVASTSVLVGEPLGRAVAGTDELEASAELARTYADVIVQEPVLRATVDQLGLDTTWEALRTRVRAEVARQNERLITVVVEAPTLDEGLAIAREIPDQLALLVAAADAGVDPGFDPNVTGFLEERRRAIRARIDATRRSLRTLREDMAAGLGPEMLARSRAQSVELQRLIIDWYEDYVTLSRFMDSTSPVDHLEIVEPPSAALEPLRSQAWPHIAQSVMIGLLLSLVVVYVLEFRERRPRPRRPRRPEGRSLEATPRPV